MNWLTLLDAFTPFVVAELQQFTNLSPNLASLISGIEAALSSVISAFKSGDKVTASTILASLQAAVVILQKQTGIDPQALSITQAVLKAIQAGLDANSNLTTVDPDALQPIHPLN